MWARTAAASPAGQRAALALLCAGLYFVWLQWVPLVDYDEPRYAEAAREMIETGDWIVPRFDYQPWYEKPILLYWLIALCFKAFGVNEFAARLPSACAATAAVLLCHAVLLRWVSRAAAFSGAVGLATMPLFGPWARVAVMDCTLTLFTTAAILGAFMATSATGAAKRRWYIAAAAAAALSVLTKGPVGLVIPAAVWAMYLLLARKLRQEVRLVPWLAAAAIFVLVAAPWPLLLWHTDGTGFFEQFLWRENVARFAVGFHEQALSRSVLGLLYFVPIALLGLCPLGPIALLELSVPRRQPARGGGTGGSPVHKGGPPGTGWQPVLPDSRLRRLACVWFAVVFLLFSLSRFKLPSYIQSLCPAAAILGALAIERQILRMRAEPSHGWRAGPALTGLIGASWGAVLLAALPAVARWAARWTADLPRPYADILFAVTGALFLIPATALFAGSVRGVRLQALTSYLASWCLGFAVLVHGPLALTFRAAGQQPALLGLTARSWLPGAHIAALGAKGGGLVFYARRQIALFSAAQERGFWRHVEHAGRSMPPVGVILESEHLPRLRSLGVVNVDERRGNWAFCRLSGVPRTEPSDARHAEPPPGGA